MLKMDEAYLIAATFKFKSNFLVKSPRFHLKTKMNKKIPLKEYWVGRHK